MQEHKREDGKKMKMKYVDMSVTILFAVALFIIYFFWGCHLDLYVTLLACLVIGTSVLTAYVQNKKINELSGEGEDNID